MTSPFFRDKITQIFVSVDDFCLEFEKPVKQLLLCEAPDVKRRNRKAGLFRLCWCLSAATPTKNNLLNFVPLAKKIFANEVL